MTLSGWGQKVLLLAIIPVPHVIILTILYICICMYRYISMVSPHPNTSPNKIHLICLNSTSKFYFFLPSPYLVPHISLDCAFQKQVRYGFDAQTDFELGPLVCKKFTIVQITLKFIPSFTDQTHILLTHCIPVRLSRNNYI